MSFNNVFSKYSGSQIVTILTTKKYTEELLLAPLADIDIILQAIFFTSHVEDATPLEVEARMPETSMVAFILQRLSHHRPIMGQSRNHCD